MYGQPYRGFESHPLRHFSGRRGNDELAAWREWVGGEVGPMSLSVGEKGSAARRVMSWPDGEKGPVARRRLKSAREAYSLYVERALEGANEANGPLSASGARWPC